MGGPGRCSTALFGNGCISCLALMSGDFFAAPPSPQGFFANLLGACRRVVALCGGIEPLAPEGRGVTDRLREPPAFTPRDVVHESFASIAKEQQRQG